MGFVGSMLSLPYMILFFFLWIVACLFWPVLLACLVVAYCHHTRATRRKLELLATTIQYLVACNDKKWKEPAKDAAFYFPKETTTTKVHSKTIIFVRHGESTWNDTFNRGGRPPISFWINFIPNLIYAVLMEWYFFVNGKENESWFYDSPLSDKGLKQALGVQSFLQTGLEYSTTSRETDMIHLMLGTSPNGGALGPPSSQLVSSNLRRAISTMAIGFQDRLHKRHLTSSGEDSILILPQLQEISRNPDALSITPPKGTVLPSWTDPEYVNDILTKRIDTRLHTGNKPVDSNGLVRMQEFCRIVFDEIDKDSIIAAGHSLWFRSFFRTFLPRTFEHVAKKKKLINGGCVGFVLKRISIDGVHHYMIDPKSITVLHGGF